MGWDHRLSRAARALAGRSPALDVALRLIALHGSHLEIALWVSLLVVRSGPAQRAAFLRAACALALANPAVLVLRRLVPRQRPFVTARLPPLVARAPGPTFPSRHTASGVAMALAVRSAAPRRGLLMGVLAAALALARVCCGLHYATDVLAGAALGALAARLCRARSHGR